MEVHIACNGEILRLSCVMLLLQCVYIVHISYKQTGGQERMITSLSVSNDPFLDICKCNAISLFSLINRRIFIMYLACFFANNSSVFLTLKQEMNINRHKKRTSFIIFVK
jgi:hypothetical protein